jgi:hypothetical protein
MLNKRVEGLVTLRLAGGEATDRLRQLDRILPSERFRSCGKKSKMLRFIVEETVLGHELKETIIGAHIFKSGYDPARDSHVRVAAGEIRDMLREYYLNGGKNDRLRIALQVGSYVPLFLQNELPEAERVEDLTTLKHRLRASEDENSALRLALAEALQKHSGIAAESTSALTLSSSLT